MRVMFSTTTGVLMFTAMRKRLRARVGREGRVMVIKHLAPAPARLSKCSHPPFPSVAGTAP